MPRGPRIDYPELLHHVIVQKIERKKIFSEKSNYENFLDRFDGLLKKFRYKSLCIGIDTEHKNGLVMSRQLKQGR